MLGATNGEAVAIGQQAIGFTTSGGSAAGWTSPIACPDGVQAGLQATAPATDTFVQLDPTTISGPTQDPGLTKTDVATCVFRLNSPHLSIVELVFIDMDASHEKQITAQLVKDGYTADPPSQSTGANGVVLNETIYRNASGGIVTGTIQVGTTPAFLVAG